MGQSTRGLLISVDGEKEEKVEVDAVAIAVQSALADVLSFQAD